MYRACSFTNIVWHSWCELRRKCVKRTEGISAISLTCRGLIQFQQLFGPLQSLIDSFHARLNKPTQPGEHIRGGLNWLHPHCPGTNQCEKVYSKVIQMLKELTASGLVSQASFNYHKKNLQIRFISRSRASLLTNCTSASIAEGLFMRVPDVES